MVKIGSNDKCPCGSNLKYKKCCLSKDIETKFKESLYKESDIITDALPILKQHFPEIEFKNVTEKLNVNTYRTLQINHYKDNVCQIAERTKLTEGVFKERDSSTDGDYDLLLMYRGAYRILHGGNGVSVYTLSLKSFFIGNQGSPMTPP